MLRTACCSVYFNDIFYLYNRPPWYHCTCHSNQETRVASGSMCKKQDCSEPFHLHSPGPCPGAHDGWRAGSGCVGRGTFPRHFGWRRDPASANQRPPSGPAASAACDWSAGRRWRRHRAGAGAELPRPSDGVNTVEASKIFSVSPSLPQHEVTAATERIF